MPRGKKAEVELTITQLQGRSKFLDKLLGNIIKLAKEEGIELILPIKKRRKRRVNKSKSKKRAAPKSKAKGKSAAAPKAKPAEAPAPKPAAPPAGTPAASSTIVGGQPAPPPEA